MNISKVPPDIGGKELTYQEWAEQEISDKERVKQNIIALHEGHKIIQKMKSLMTPEEQEIIRDMVRIIDDELSIGYGCKFGLDKSFQRAIKEIDASIEEQRFRLKNMNIEV